MTTEAVRDTAGLWFRWDILLQAAQLSEPTPCNATLHSQESEELLAFAGASESCFLVRSEVTQRSRSLRTKRRSVRVKALSQIT